MQKTVQRIRKIGGYVWWCFGSMGDADDIFEDEDPFVMHVHGYRTDLEKRYNEALKYIRAL